MAGVLRRGPRERRAGTFVLRAGSSEPCKAGANIACCRRGFRIDSGASMGIADLFRPKYRHSDPRVRAEAVRALTSDDAATLVQIARTDRDVGVRRLAIERIGTAEVLAEIASADPERSLQDL